MKHPIIRIALLAALATPALVAATLAQSDDDFDPFVFSDGGTPLDELVPDTDELPPPQPYFDDSIKATVAPETASETTTPLAPVAETAAPSDNPPTIASLVAPSDWKAYDIAGYHFLAPPDWNAVVKSDDGLMLFGGDMATRIGPMFGVIFDNQHMPDEDEDANILSRSEVTMPNGEIYRRVEMTQDIDEQGMLLHLVAYISSDPNEDDDYTIITLGAYNQPYEKHRAVLENILGTLTLPEKVQPARSVALDGLVSFDVPRKWPIHTSGDGEQVSFRTPYYSGYVEIAIRGRLTGEFGLESTVPANATAPEPVEVFGIAATRQSWTGTSAEFWVGASPVVGEYTYYRLSQCLPDGAPIGIITAGAPAFYEDAEFAAAFASIELSTPAGMMTCGARPSPARVPAPADTAATTPPAQRPAQSPAQSPAQPPAPLTHVDTGKSSSSSSVATSAPDPVQSTPVTTMPPPVASAPVGVLIDIEGASFVLPEGWVTTLDSPSDKMFESPDGQVTILAFWWFPDEPLTGYEDDISVKHVMIDHESVTRISSRIAERFSVMNVSERARGDEKRFIFTVESDALGLERLQALNEALVQNLRLQPALDPDWREETNVAPVPATQPAPVVARPTPIPVPAATSLPRSVRFGTSGVGRWQGENVTLSNPGSGGSNGAGVLDAMALGDGENGYFLAPADLLGDWHNAVGMQLVLTLKSGNGSYYGPYDDDGRGDIYIENGAMSASFGFDHPVGFQWTTQTVMFDDPRWQLSGGARSVRDVLANVTRFDVRAEYLNGDTRSAMASIDWLGAAGIAPPQQPAGTGKRPGADPGWQSYSNTRFGTQISYPTHLFAPMPPPENNDGRSFSGIDGGQKFYVFGQFNIDALGIPALMDRDISLGGYNRITYKTSGNDWYVFSGYVGKNIFYHKVLVDTRNEVLHVFEITYPAALKAAYDQVVTDMAASFSRP